MAPRQLQAPLQERGHSSSFPCGKDTGRVMGFLTSALTILWASMIGHWVPTLLCLPPHLRNALPLHLEGVQLQQGVNLLLSSILLPPPGSALGHSSSTGDQNLLPYVTFPTTSVLEGSEFSSQYSCIFNSSRILFARVLPISDTKTFISSDFIFFLFQYMQ